MKDGSLHTELETANQLRALFKPATWLTKIDFINHLVLFNNVLITVLSEHSGGKTSFSTLLLNNLDPQIKPVFMGIKPPTNRGDVLSDIASQLHLNLNANTNVNALVAQINERKAHVLLIIDDAQHVPEDLIKDFIIAIRNQEEFGFFHLCLVSDYSVVATLNNMAADQFNNLIHTIELGGLSESETRTYVVQRAMAARLINKPLTDNQLKQFYQLTKGSIARINSNLDTFIFKCSTQKERNKGLIAKRTALAASVAALAGLSFLYLDNLYNKPLVPELELISSIPSLQSTMLQAVSLAQNELSPSSIPSLLDSSTVQLVHNALPKKQILDLPEEEQVVNTVALVDRVIVIPAIKDHEPITEINIANTKKAPEQQPLKPLQNRLSHTPKASQKAKTVARVAHLAGYTIQLVASHEKREVYHFQQSSKLYAATKIRHFNNAKGEWYILTVGDFNTRSQAQERISNLPAPLAKLKPWIRPVSGLTEPG